MTVSPPWKKKVDLFRSKFVAREDRFLIRSPQMVTKEDKLTGEVKLQEKTHAMPACGNYGDISVCLLTQNKGGGCATCDSRKYKPVTDEEVWKHLSGEQEMILLMLREEGIRFGAADFDKGNTFEDAKMVRDLSVSCGIQCHIAKSTQKGFHLYWFFSDFVKPHEFSSYIRYLFEELGLYQRYNLNPSVGLPEVFPKQTVFSGSTGNGIKVPMMETKMREGRNCWVDDDGEPLPLDKQWPYLESIVPIARETFEQVLKDKNIEILAAPASRSPKQARVAAGKAEGTEKPAKPFGSFWNVVEACPALKEYWQKDEKGKVLWDQERPEGLFHDARVASMMIALSTTDGEEALKTRWPSSKTNQQIEHAKATGYTPVTCKWMQDHRVCHVGKHPKCGNHCMKKLPPVVYENGQRVVNPDGLSEEQWPEPSPIRYATDRNLTIDDIKERLAEIFRALKESSKKHKIKKDDKEKPPPPTGFVHTNPQERIDGLLDRALSFEDPKDWESVKSYVTLNKWMGVRELNQKEKNFKLAKASTKTEKAKSTNPSFSYGGRDYVLKDGHYIMIWRDSQGRPCETPITNYHLQFLEEHIEVRANDSDDLSDCLVAEDRRYKITAYVDGHKRPATATHRDLGTPDAFFKWISQHGGISAVHFRSDYDHIRLCLKNFNKEMVTRQASRQIGHHRFNGQFVYVMPSVVIDKDAVRQNEELVVVPFEDDLSKGLDFKLLSHEEFKDLANHIVTDFFNCNNSVLTMTTFAHAMAAAIIPQIQASVGYTKAPVLWLGGSQSGGKTFVASVVQNFFGKFDFTQSANTTSKARLGNGYNFRHAWMLIDDYKKHLADPTGKEFPQFIQGAYDRNGRQALQRQGDLRRRSDRVRGLVAITGEDVIECDASVISRTLLIDVPYNRNNEAGNRVVKRKADYCGFTPYFIKFVLNLSSEEIQDLWDTYYNEFMAPVTEKQKNLGPERVCENLTLAMVAFRLCMEMLVAEGAIPEVQRDELCRRQKINLELVRTTIFESIDHATGANVFLDALRELLQNPSKCIVYGWPGYNDIRDSASSTQIGFYREKTPGIIYIYPQVAHGMASEMVRKNSNHTQTLRHVARQLYDDGFMAKEKIRRDSGKYSVQVRGPAKNLVNVWPLSIEALGLDIDYKKETVKARVEDDNLIPFDVGSNKKPN